MIPNERSIGNPTVCQQCGHVSTIADPVRLTTARIYDLKWIEKYECADRLACWERWDRRYLGFVSPAVSLALAARQMGGTAA